MAAWRVLARVSFVAMALIGALHNVAAAMRSADKAAAAPEITDDDLKAVQVLLQKMAAAFVAGDEKACVQLFAPNAEGRDKLSANLQNEFRQSRYLKFEIVQVLPEDTLRKNVHSVDVRLRLESLLLCVPLTCG